LTKPLKTNRDGGGDELLVDIPCWCCGSKSDRSTDDIQESHNKGLTHPREDESQRGGSENDLRGIFIHLGSSEKQHQRRGRPRNKKEQGRSLLYRRAERENASAIPYKIRSQKGRANRPYRRETRIVGWGCSKHRTEAELTERRPAKPEGKNLIDRYLGNGTSQKKIGGHPIKRGGRNGSRDIKSGFVGFAGVFLCCLQQTNFGEGGIGRTRRSDQQEGD